MPAYVTFFNWTEQGVRDMKNAANRARVSSEMWEAAGGRFIGIWWTFGQYDGIFIHETPDDETANRLLMSLAMKGNVRTTTLRAFGEEDIDRILGML